MTDSVSSGKFTLKTPLIYQQDLAPELESLLISKPEFKEAYLKAFGEDIHDEIGSHLALRCCLPLTMHRYLQSAGYLADVSAVEYIEKVWSAFCLESSKNWSRPILSKITRETYNVPIISCGIRWLNSDLTEDDKVAMVKSGYLQENQIQDYERLFHGKTIPDILAYSPNVLTIKNPFGTGGVHSVIAWSIEGSDLLYSNVDARDGREILNRMPLAGLETEETRNGAITVLLQ